MMPVGRKNARELGPSKIKHRINDPIYRSFKTYNVPKFVNGNCGQAPTKNEEGHLKSAALYNLPGNKNCALKLCQLQIQSINVRRKKQTEFDKGTRRHINAPNFQSFDNAYLKIFLQNDITLRHYQI